MFHRFSPIIVVLFFYSIILAAGEPSKTTKKEEPKPANLQLPEANETAVIGACRTYAAAQNVFRRTDWDNDGVLEYAVSLKSYAAEEVAAVRKKMQVEIKPIAQEQRAELEKLLPDLGAEEFEKREEATKKIMAFGLGACVLLEDLMRKTDDAEINARCARLLAHLAAAAASGVPAAEATCALYDVVERNNRKVAISLIDKAFADAEYLACNKQLRPKQGYYFKVLCSTKKGGVQTFITDGHMTMGFALVAFPAEYGKTGRHTFVTDASGMVYRKDLGEDTLKICEALTAFPDVNEARWTLCE